MDKTDILTNIGLILGGVFAAIIAYTTKKPPTAPSDAIVTGVGIELGSRHQTERLIEQMTRLADSAEVLADRKRAEMEEKLDEVLERLDEQEEREGRRR